MNWSTWHVGQKNSESPKRIEPMTSRTPGGCSIHWASRAHGGQGHLNWVQFNIFIYLSEYWKTCMKELIKQDRRYEIDKMTVHKNDLTTWRTRWKLNINEKIILPNLLFTRFVEFYKFNIFSLWYVNWRWKETHMFWLLTFF